MYPQKLSEHIFYIGVNDRHKPLFENMIPLPHGVSYNSYIVHDEKIAIIDTVEAPFTEQHIDNIKKVIGDKHPDFLIINHMEPDHSSGISAIVNHYPNIKIVGNKKTFGLMEGFYGINSEKIEVNECDELNLGTSTLRFHMTPMVHWPEVMMTYETKSKTLFSADAFGCFGTLDGAVKDTDLNLSVYFDEAYRYYANIVGKYGAPTQTALKKLASFNIDTICSTHGPVWTTNKNEIVRIYDQLSRYESESGVVIAFGSMYGNTELMAEAVAEGAMKVTKNVKLYDVSKTDATQILGDIFRYKGVILGAPTYCNQLYPNMQTLIDKIETRGLKNRVFGIFGSFSWAGAATKNLNAFAERMKWTVEQCVEVKQSMQECDYQALTELGKGVAEKAN